MAEADFEKRVLLSGIQPSGELNIGGYLGALRQWRAMQMDYQCYFCLVDLHTLTVPQAPDVLRERCLTHMALYLACGLDPEQQAIFLQSQVAEHTQFAWLLNCITGMGELSRMTQFKDKSQRAGQNINVGLFAYPVLMAADILLYGADVVPVGEDQKQHLELARDLAMRFNHQWGPLLVVPEPMIPSSGARIMGLQTPTQKMSKSDPNVGNSLALLDPPEVITKKIKRAVTDVGSDICQAADKPGITNLLTLFSGVTGDSVATLEQRFQGQGYGQFKQALAEAVVAFVTPIQQAYSDYRADPAQLLVYLHQGAEKARARVQPRMQAICDAVGLLR